MTDHEVNDAIRRKCELCGRLFSANDNARFCSTDCMESHLENSVELEDLAY